MWLELAKLQRDNCGNNISDVKQNVNTHSLWPSLSVSIAEMCSGCCRHTYNEHIFGRFAILFGWPQNIVVLYAQERLKTSVITTLHAVKLIRTQPYKFSLCAQFCKLLWQCLQCLVWSYCRLPRCVSMQMVAIHKYSMAEEDANRKDIVEPSRTSCTCHAL